MSDKQDELNRLIGRIVRVEYTEDVSRGKYDWQDDGVTLVYEDGRRVILMALGFHQSGSLHVTEEQA